MIIVFELQNVNERKTNNNAVVFYHFIQVFVLCNVHILMTTFFVVDICRLCFNGYHYRIMIALNITIVFERVRTIDKNKHVFEALLPDKGNTFHYSFGY